MIFQNTVDNVNEKTCSTTEEVNRIPSIRKGRVTECFFCSALLWQSRTYLAFRVY